MWLILIFIKNICTIINVGFRFKRYKLSVILIIMNSQFFNCFHFYVLSVIETDL